MKKKTVEVNAKIEGTADNKSAFEKMTEDIEKIREALGALNKIGVSKELMEIYIQHKTKLGKYKIIAVLNAQMEFLDNAIKK